MLVNWMCAEDSFANLITQFYIKYYSIFSSNNQQLTVHTV